jgi:hypothetical protein
MKIASTRWTRIVGFLQLAGVLLAFCLTFAHGVVLGQYDVGFRPEYRVRQTLAVAISRLHKPAAHSYLAYQSVIDVLNDNGFAIFPGDKGLHLDDAGWTALLLDPARTDRMMQQAKDATIDRNLAPQLIRGNEVAYADYFYIAFLLFGLHMTSLYYLYFLLLGVACILFVIEFRRSPFLMFLLTTYLGGLFFLQNYAESQGDQLVTLANSRLFDALSLLPAIHVFLVIWKRMPAQLSTLATTTAQSILLAFLIDCRITARWQIVMIVATALALLLIEAWRRRSLKLQWRGNAWYGVWAAAVAFLILVAHMTLIDFTTDRRYEAEPKYHGVWDSVLGGILGTSKQLQREYLGRAIGDDASPLPDDVIEEAINIDLNKRNDMSSPQAVMQDGRIVISMDNGVKGVGADYGWNEYERLARSLAIRIIMQHPITVLAEFYSKGLDQIERYNGNDALSFGNLAGMIMFAIAGGLMWLSRGVLDLTTVGLVRGIGAAMVVLVFAAAPAMIEPSALSVGTLLSYLVVGMIAPFMLILVFLKYRDSKQK